MIRPDPCDTLPHLGCRQCSRCKVQRLLNLLLGLELRLLVACCLVQVRLNLTSKLSQRQFMRSACRLEECHAGSASCTRRTAWGICRMIFSPLMVNQRENHQEQVDHYSDEVTHVIAVTDSNGCCQRTMKFMLGLLQGKWIVSFDCTSHLLSLA